MSTNLRNAVIALPFNNNTIEINFANGKYNYRGNLIKQTFTGVAISNFSKTNNIYCSIEKNTNGLWLDGKDPQGVITIVPGQFIQLDNIPNLQIFTAKMGGDQIGNGQLIVFRASNLYTT